MRSVQKPLVNISNLAWLSEFEVWWNSDSPERG